MLIHQPLAFGWLQGNKGGREKPHETPNYVVTAFSFLAHEEKKEEEKKKNRKKFFPYNPSKPSPSFSRRRQQTVAVTTIIGACDCFEENMKSVLFLFIWNKTRPWSTFPVFYLHYIIG